MESRRHVDGDDALPHVFREVSHRRHVLDAGIVDQNVHAAELLGRERNHVADLGRLAHVGGRMNHLDAVVRRQFAANGFDRSGVAKAIQQQVAALLGQRRGNAQSDAAGGAGNDRIAMLEHGEFLRLMTKMGRRERTNAGQISAKYSRYLRSACFSPRSGDNW